MQKNERIFRKNKTIIFSALGVLLLSIVLFGASKLVTFLNYKRDVQRIQAQNIDLNNIPDGEYYGDCNVDFVAARVRVIIEDHRIAVLELLEHINDRGASAEVLPERMIKEQRIDVDAISGATASSKVIQEAVYNALTGDRTIRE